MKIRRQVFYLLVGITLISLSGCGNRLKLKSEDIKSNTITIDSKGKVQEGSVESFGENYYSEKECKEFVEDTVVEYQQEHGKDSLKLDSFRVKDKKATMILHFASIQDYANLHGTTARQLSLEQAKDEDWMPEQLTRKKDGKSVAVSSISEKKLKVLVIDESCEVRVDGTILYYSNANELKDKKDDSLQTSEDGLSVIIYQS